LKISVEKRLVLPLKNFMYFYQVAYKVSEKTIIFKYLNLEYLNLFEDAININERKKQLILRKNNIIIKIMM
jgi:hypothetical protein